ncbi:MAG: hypothetical protein J7623_13110 [Chitinophaga sp.]|uniref:hypothetical protein n=1 Tax=Chitinophaga sp. TaxID=1869181 RepID=UPI001B1D2CD4|nr:hypothetical protein [Chitinophaga sp.]MBO9729570.1 hypothetical protein [Chitinophaga sp.]
MKQTSDDPCEAILRNGVFRTSFIKYNENYRRAFFDFIYQSNFQSAQDVTDAGLSVQLLTDIGIPVGGSGNFDQQKYQEWRSLYNRQITDIQSKQLAFTIISSYADTSLTNNWYRCKYLQARVQDKGLQLLLQDAGPNLAILTASFDGIGDDASTRFSNMSIDGGKVLRPSANPFKKGIRIGSGGKSVMLKRIAGKSLNIIFETTAQSKNAQLKSPPPLGLVYFYSDQQEVYVGDSVTVKWEIISSDIVTLNGEIVPAKGEKTIKVVDTLLLELKGRSLSGRQLTASKKIFPAPRLTTLVSGEIELTTAAWMDGKDADTHMHFLFRNANGKEVFAYFNESNNWPLEGNASQTAPLTLLPGVDPKELTKKALSNLTVTGTKYPNGHDKVTMYVNLTLKFNNSTAMKLSQNSGQYVLRLEDQGQQDFGITMQGVVTDEYIITASKPAAAN